jgi:hypothetical protein
MEKFKSMFVTVAESESALAIINDVLLDANLKFNKDSSIIPDGRGDPLDGNVSGKNIYHIKVFDVAEEIKSKVSNEKVYVQLDGYDGTMIIIDNAKPIYNGNDIIFETEEYTRIIK